MYSSAHVLLWIFHSGLPLSTETLHTLLSLSSASTQVTGTSSSASHHCSIITTNMLLESATRSNPAFLCSQGTDTSLSLFHEACFRNSFSTAVSLALIQPWPHSEICSYGLDGYFSHQSNSHSPTNSRDAGFSLTVLQVLHNEGNLYLWPMK